MMGFEPLCHKSWVNSAEAAISSNPNRNFVHWSNTTAD